MKKTKLNKSSIILISTLIAVPVALGLGFLISPVFAGCLAVAFGCAGNIALIVNNHFERTKDLRKEIKKIKAEQTTEIPYESLTEVKSNEKTLYKETVENSQHNIKNEDKETLEN